MITPQIGPRQGAGGGSGGSQYGGGTAGPGTKGPSSGNTNRFGMNQKENAINSEHMIHLSLSEGLDQNFPFGNSLLENVFKVYKQKELLEDAILIYRIQRAPERRVFHIDVGNMPSHMAMAFVDRVKNEIHQRRIPSVQGGQSVVDATYNPLSINEDYFFPVTADGRGSDVTLLQGGQNLGEIDDLRYFNNRLARGLRVPSSYLPTGPEDGQIPLSDGRVGTAMIQEFRFNQYCERLQNYICLRLNEEFKLFMRWRGFNIDSGLFDIKFNAPQNFAAYRQSELDKDRVSTFQAIEAYPYISKRFALERFLGLTEEEIKENERLWEEERTKPEEEAVKGSDLRSIGISAGDIETDSQNAEMPPEENQGPTEVVPPVTGPESMPAGPTTAGPAMPTM
jgi:hypothetical protein